VRLYEEEEEKEKEEILSTFLSQNCNLGLGICSFRSNILQNNIFPEAYSWNHIQIVVEKLKKRDSSVDISINSRLILKSSFK
jgi:hypothetical protein